MVQRVGLNQSTASPEATEVLHTTPSEPHDSHGYTTRLGVILTNESA